jgi:hypothetical protein
MDLEPGGFTSHNTYEDIYIYIYIYMKHAVCVQVPSCLSDLALAVIGIMRS